MNVLTGWHYWYVRYFGWIPVQFCRVCKRPYWGGWPMRGWQASMREYCSKACFDAGAEMDDDDFRRHH